MRLVRGAIAQLGERFIRIEEVRGSSPLSSTNIRKAGNNSVPGLSCG